MNGLNPINLGGLRVRQVRFNAKNCGEYGYRCVEIDGEQIKSDWCHAFHKIHTKENVSEFCLVFYKQFSFQIISIFTDLKK